MLPRSSVARCGPTVARSMGRSISSAMSTAAPRSCASCSTVWATSVNVDGQVTAAHPDGRTAIFLGDLVDRGPDSPAVLRLVMSMVATGNALCVPGNHDTRLVRKLRGRDVQLTHGLAETLAQLEGEPEHSARQAADFLDGLISHYVLDDGKLVVAHAGLKAEMQGRASARVRDFALYGETTGETDESACRCAPTGPPNTAARPGWCTAIRRLPSPNG